ncbi:LAGLIDADG family homing endonuclease [Candidatus Nomurabacteria bacterium]|nr:LAGLIDADG family homing endonuclease [Candidatus Nomurabacteria bacterium]
MSKVIREVSRVRNTKQQPSEKDGRRNYKLQAPFGKEQIRGQKLHPQYIVGFIDGEGSFNVSVSKHKTLKRRLEIRAQFEIELRADDRDILERICLTLGCGRIYDLSYDRYGWYPHIKYKVGSIKDMQTYLIPFFDRYPPQAKKGEVYKLFKEVIKMVSRKEHLTNDGFNKILKLRDQIRSVGKKAKTHGNR